MKYTPKQIEKYKRQKYISHIDKIGKNLFRMFRGSTDAREFMEKFSTLMDTLESMESQNLYLNSQYLKASYEYYQNLYREFLDVELDDSYLDSIREAQMSNLNRLQKLKNRASYKKEKHKNSKFR